MRAKDGGIAWATWRRRRAAKDPETLELVLASIVELDAGSGDEVMHRAGHKDLVRLGQARDSLADVNGDAADIVSDELDLTGMEASSNLDAEIANGVRNGSGSADGTSRTVEDGKKAVARRLDLPASVTEQLGAHHLVMGGEQVPPLAIAEPSRLLSGLDNVGEQHGGQDPVKVGSRKSAGQELLDPSQDRARVSRGKQEIRSRYLQVLRGADMTGDIPAERRDHVIAGRDDQRWHRHNR
jgi:hypothetical protein